MNKLMCKDTTTMSSREIADLVGSRHDKVKQSIVRLIDREVITQPPMGDESHEDGSDLIHDLDAPSIYQIRNLHTGKVYVGSAVHPRKRWNLHRHQLRNSKHHSVKLQRAWNKYGHESFVFEVIRSVAEKSMLLVEEQLEIDSRESYSKGYNSRPDAGSQLGSKHSPETRKKLSDSHKGNTFSHTEETKKKIGAANKGKRRADEWRKEKSAAMKGIKHTEDSKKSMQQAQISRWASAPFRARKDSKVGLVGVKQVGLRFQSRIRMSGKLQHLGMFDTALEAHEAYLEAMRHKRALMAEVLQLEA